MIKTRFFRLPEHKQFDFPTRYYNEDKERHEERKKQLEKELNLSDSEVSVKLRKEELHRRLQREWNGSRTKEMRKANLRVVIILAILCVVFYYVLINLDNLIR